ncbi:hypothetical protein HETIRDRAFT_315078, partial [Heterobasidion irregulare TC 32-1]
VSIFSTHLVLFSISLKLPKYFPWTLVQVYAHQCASASPVLISAFISTLTGTYSSSAIKNYIYGVRVWHILHGAPWKLNDDEINALMTGSAHTAPTTSWHKKQRLYTP